MERCKLKFPTSAKARTIFGMIGTLFGSILFLAARRLLGRLMENKPQNDVSVKMSHKAFQKLANGH